VTVAEARRFVSELDLDVDRMPICLACLSIVSMQIDTGSPRKINGAVQSITPDLWAEGLELPAWAALEDARDREVPGAEAAIADVLRRGSRSPVARAIVRLLAEQLAERSGGDPLKMGFQPWPPPPRALSALPPLPPLEAVDVVQPLEMEVRIWRIPNRDN
jgi:hypothetical protein